MDERSETEVWFRNPKYYMKQLAEVGCYNLVFDQAYVASRRMDVKAYAGLYFGVNIPWRVLVIHRDRAVLYESGFSNPTAVYPVWSAAKHSPNQLVELIKDPWGQRSKLIDNVHLTRDEKPVRGQRNIIVMIDLPAMRHVNSKLFMEDLSEFQADHPEATFYLHGLYSYPIMFRKNFRMVDCDARTASARGEVQLPCGGGPLKAAELREDTLWISILGHRIQDLKDPANRCIYNIKSAIFAGRYYKKIARFAINRSRKYGYHDLDLNAPDIQNYIKENSVVFTRRLVSRPGDRIVCDDCSLWMSCKYYREGQVCVVPGSEMKDVAEMFKSRDATNITNALSRLIAVNTARIESALVDESGANDETDKNKGIDPNLTKLIDSTFRMGHELLKIVDPSQRAGKSAVNVNVGPGATRVEIGGNDSQALATYVVSILEARGHKPEHITDEMIAEVMREVAMADPMKAIPGTVVP